jgi:hypothetical protein
MSSVHVLKHLDGNVLTKNVYNSDDLEQIHLTIYYSAVLAVRMIAAKTRPPFIEAVSVDKKKTSMVPANRKPDEESC